MPKDGKVLVVSAMPNGAAEKVLRALCTSPPDHWLQRLGFVWIEPTSGVLTAEGIFRIKGEIEPHRVLLVLGKETGLCLRDHNLPNGKHFSMKHILGATSEGVHYVVPISPAILKTDSVALNDPTDVDICKRIASNVSMNIRRATNEICSFLLKYYKDDFTEQRRIIERAETDRLARMSSHCRRLPLHRRSHVLDKERYAGLWA